MKRLLILIPVLIGFGCGSKATAPSNQADYTAPNTDDSWFCQVGATDEEWDCVQSEALAAAHTPTRLPASRAPTSNVAAATVPVNDDQNESAPLIPSAEPLPAEPVEVRPAPSIPTQPEPQSTSSAAPEPEPASTPPPIPPIDTTNNQKTQSRNEPKHIQLSYRPEKPVAILDLPKAFWAVQLVALSSKEALEAFAKENNVRGMSAARVWNGQGLFYVLLLGIYETRDRASQAIASLTAPFDTYNPWIRSVGSLQTAMVEADRQSGSSKI